MHTTHLDQKRTIDLRLRYFALILDALESCAGEPLPGSGPTWEEISQRWAS